MLVSVYTILQCHILTPLPGNTSANWTLRHWYFKLCHLLCLKSVHFSAMFYSPASAPCAWPSKSFSAIKKTLVERRHKQGGRQRLFVWSIKQWSLSNIRSTEIILNVVFWVLVHRHTWAEKQHYMTPPHPPPSPHKTWSVQALPSKECKPPATIDWCVQHPGIKNIMHPTVMTWEWRGQLCFHVSFYVWRLLAAL